MTRRRRSTIVEVEWQDATSADEWMPLADAKRWDPAHVRSVGYVVHMSKREVRLAMQQNTVGHVAITLVIPRGMVRRVTRLR